MSPELLTIHCGTKPPETNAATHAPPLFQSICRENLLTPSYEVPISLKFFPMTSSHPIRDRSAFYLALDGLPERTIFGKLLSVMRRPGPSNHNFCLIIALENRIEPHFSCRLLFEIRSVGRAPKVIFRQFFWKTSNKSSFVFWSVHFKTTLGHCHLCNFQYFNLGSETYIAFLPKFFQLLKYTLSLFYSTFNIFTTSTHLHL